MSNPLHYLLANSSKPSVLKRSSTLSTVKALTTATLLSLVSIAPIITHADDKPDVRDLIHFDTTVSQVVTNDQMTAILYTEIQNQEAGEVERQLTEQINNALAISKRYPDIKVSTTERSTRPQYNYKNNNALTGWQGRAAITLTTQNITKASELIANLQPNLKLQNISFGVTDSTRQAVISQLMIKASQQFQNQAKALLPVWSATGYQLVKLDLIQGGFATHMPRMEMAVMTVGASKQSMPIQNYESGESSIKVTAKGTIALQK